MAHDAQWAVIHMTKSESNADIILDALREEGFLSRTRQVYRKLSSGENYYEILVPGAEAQEAQQVLIEKNLLL